MDFLKEGWNSLIKVLKNPVLLVPDLFFYVVTYILTIFFYKSSGIDNLLQEVILNEAAKVELFKAFVVTNWFHLLVSGMVFVIITFFIGVSVEVLRFRMIKDVLNKKKVLLIKTLLTRSPYFFKVVFLKIYVYVLTVIMVVIFMSIMIINGQTGGGMVAGFFKLLISLLGISIIVFINLGILYRYAILFLSDEKRSYRTIRRSFKLFLKESRHVAIVWVVIMLVGLGLWFILAGLGSLTGMIQQLLTGSISLYLLSLFSTLVVYLVRLVYNLWEHMFVFSTYKPIKKSS